MHHKLHPVLCRVILDFYSGAWIYDWSQILPNMSMHSAHVMSLTIMCMTRMAYETGVLVILMCLVTAVSSIWIVPGSICRVLTTPFCWSVLTSRSLTEIVRGKRDELFEDDTVLPSLGWLLCVKLCICQTSFWGGGLNDYTMKCCAQTHYY